MRFDRHEGANGGSSPYDMSRVIELNLPLNLAAKALSLNHVEG